MIATLTADADNFPPRLRTAGRGVTVVDQARRTAGATMPVMFLTEEQRSSYGTFTAVPDDAQLAGFFLLDRPRAERNDPRFPQLDTDDLDRYPVYLRYEQPDNKRDEIWCLERVTATVNPGGDYRARS
ncbi:hypothetical protein [Wenjunlia vitaminophila]|nr:hypothetical protein [Wenjunlia vitaminophila]